MSKELTIRTVAWDGPEGKALRAIRRRVFIEEQSVPEAEEWDDLDAVCLHFLAEDQNREPLGTARLAANGKIARVAVLRSARGRGVGRALMDAALAEAHSRGQASVHLDAQVEVIDFYRQLGFEAEGPIFLDAGIPHRRMHLAVVQ